MLASQSFMTSVVVGKDIVPRIGLNQLETLRLQLMEEIKNSKQSKVKQFSFRLEHVFLFLTVEDHCTQFLLLQQYF